MAFLTVRDSCEIRISAVEDIRLFYVQQNSFSDRLDRLMVEMHRAISDFGDKETRWCELGIEEVFEGLFCAVKVNEEWLRGRVESLVPMQSDHLIVVFCVDFGDYVHLNISGSSPQPSKFLRRIDRKFIERLPFQAIPCVFHNRKTLIDRMDEKACQHRGDLLWDISRDLLLRPYSLFAFTSAKLKKKSGVVVYVVSVFFRGEDVFDKVFYAGNNPSVESIDHQKYVLSGDDCQNNLMKLLSRIKFNHFEELGNTQVEFLINVLYSESSGSFENFSLACQCLELIVRSKRLKSVNVCQIWSEDPPPPVRWYLAGNYQVRIHEFPGYIYHYTGLLLATLNLLVVCPAEVARNILVRHSLISAISIIAILSEDNIDCEPTTINICKIISLSCKIFDNQSLADFWIESDICWDHCFHLNQLDILAKLCNLLNLGTSDEIRTCAVVAIEALCSRTPWMLFIPTVEYNIVGSILSLLAQAESLASVEPMLWLLTSVLAQKDFCLDADISSTFSCLRAASSNVQNLIADNQEDFETLAESLNKCETAFNRILRAELTRVCFLFWIFLRPFFSSFLCFYSFGTLKIIREIA